MSGMAGAMFLSSSPTALDLQVLTKLQSLGAHQTMMHMHIIVHLLHVSFARVHDKNVRQTPAHNLGMGILCLAELHFVIPKRVRSEATASHAAQTPACACMSLQQAIA